MLVKVIYELICDSFVHKERNRVRVVCSGYSMRRKLLYPGGKSVVRDLLTKRGLVYNRRTLHARRTGHLAKPRMATHSIGLLLLLLGFGCPSWCLRPRLNVSEEFVVDTRTENFLAIRCEGTEQLYWNWTGYVSLEDDVLTITKEKHTNTDRPFISTLTIKSPVNEDTGFYRCHYEGATDIVTDEERSASTYAYVYDGSQRLLFMHNLPIKVTTADKLILDCRTTLPNITVHLTKIDDKIPASRAQWDPKIGFVFRNLAIHDSGIYQCSVDDAGEQSSFYVQVDPRKSALPKPAINWETSQHFVVGYEFRINCSVLIEDRVTFHWDIPNPSSNHTKIPGKMKRQTSNYRVNTLIIYNATLQDSGTYKCTVSASGKDSNDETREITIKKTLKPYMNISSIPSIPIMEGDFLKWKATVLAFPPGPEIIYRTWRGNEVKETPRITTEHYENNAESWLKIQNITAEDFGNYTIEAILTDASIRESHTTLVKVKSKPYPKLLGVPQSIEVGKVLLVHCKTLGFPVVNTTWAFKDCPNGEQNCDSEFVRLQPDEEDTKLLPPGNIVNVFVLYRPNVSGLLRCEAENELGTASETVPVSISDIGGNIVFQHIGEGSSTNVTGDKGKLDIVVNDRNFELMCGASKFFYSTASLTLPQSGLRTTRNETSFSRQHHAFTPRVDKSLSGKYLCSALPHGESEEVVKELVINVLDEEPVKFDHANMLPEGNEYFMKENEPFYLNCTVSGTPTPKISWFKDDEPLLPDDPFFDDTVIMNKTQQTIYFKYVFKENLGTYSCTAENRLGKVTGYLTITAPSPGLSTGGKVGLALALIGIAVLVIVVVYLVKRVKKERRFRKSFRQNELYLFEKGNIGQLNPDCTADEQAELLPYDPVWEVDRNSIRIGKQLGAGAFGRVVKAVVSRLDEEKPTTTVAVKMCKSQADQSQVRALALELKIMIHLGKHLNIVNLMGANTVHIGKGELWILVEYCRFGNLLSFMHRHRNKFINQIDPTTGKIDFTKVNPDAMSPFSPTSYSSGSRGYQTSPITDMDGYLAPTASKFNLSSPPNRRQTPSPPQSPTPLIGSTNSSYRSDGSDRHVDNPMYNMMLKRSISENPEGGPVIGNNPTVTVDAEAVAAGKARLNSITSLDNGKRLRMDSITHSDSGGKPRLNSNCYSDTGSVGYSRGDVQITNTDMTVLPATNSHLSPLSPTDSNHMSDVGVDSKGNPFHFDAGIVPAVTAPFTTSDLVCWAWQVAQGMDYLSQRKVLHGDLAARNLLLADDNVIKISDFGLSREMYKKDVYMKKGDDLMPIKWMAVEAIRDRIFSVQSDVWAYGVTLWELFTLGSTPYPGIEVNKDFLKLIEDGHRMDRPKFANKEVYDILLSCWESDPRQRPSFALIAERLGILMLPDLRGQYMDMNDPYLRMNEERFRNDTDYLNMLASPNFDNLHKEDEANLHYVNVGKMPDSSRESRESNYLDMKSPNSVGYSRIGFNPSSGSTSEDMSMAPKPHYLPMDTTQRTPSPMVDVFSPRPNEIPRFTFGQNTTDRPVQLSDLPEEDECTSQRNSKDSGDHVTERASLINSSSENSSRENVSDDTLLSSNNVLQSKPTVDEETENEPILYVNLPTHGVSLDNL